jgi:3-deoxy-manno-octulosonate cytidylyltransferase (CMP-KDO synthetase)
MPHRAPHPEARPRIHAVAIVPARIGSQRLPRKMLLAETGTCLFEHTVRNLGRCPAIERVVVATDSAEIAEIAKAHGIEARMTRAEHTSGTDRVHEALAQIGAEAIDVVVNVQGDEPELDPGDLAALVAAFADASVAAATLCGRIASVAEAEAAQVVKVVRDARGDALYFSRSPVPFRAHDATRAYARAGAPRWLDVVRRHIGVYAFRPPVLARFCGLGPSALEQLENLEQLRWLEAGERMRVIEARHVPLGIDTRDDYDAFVQRTANSGTGSSGRVVDERGG